MCGGRDLDDVFAYSTGRKVLIRGQAVPQTGVPPFSSRWRDRTPPPRADRRLGLLFLSCQVGIALYVVVYQILLSQAYLRPGDIFGMVRMQVRPTCSGRGGRGGGDCCSSTWMHADAARAAAPPQLCVPVA